MDRRPGVITLGLVPPGSQRRTTLGSRRRRQAGEEKPRPKMGRASIRALVAKHVLRQHETKVVIENLPGAEAPGYSAAPAQAGFQLPSGGVVMEPGDFIAG